MATDQELVAQTVLDCFAVWYDAEVARTDRALDRGLVKLSPGKDGGAILAKDVVLRACAGGDGTTAADRWLEIDIMDVCGDIAGDVACSAPCREYLHLIRTGDGWKAADALWPPR